MVKKPDQTGSYFEDGVQKFARGDDPVHAALAAPEVEPDAYAGLFTEIEDDFEQDKPKHMMDAPEHEFFLQDVLQVVSGRMLSSTGDYSAVYELLAYMTQHEIDDIMYPDAIRLCRVAVLQQHPQFDDEKYLNPEIDTNDVEHWLKKEYRRNKGEYVVVKKLPLDIRQKFTAQQQEKKRRRQPPKKSARPIVNDKLLRFSEDD